MKIEKILLISAAVAAVAAVVMGGIRAARSQDAPKAVAPTEYVLRLQPGDIIMIGEGLGLLPYEKVKGTIFRVQSQINAQEAQAAVDAAKAKAEAEKATKSKK